MQFNTTIVGILVSVYREARSLQKRAQNLIYLIMTTFKLLAWKCKATKIVTSSMIRLLINLRDAPGRRMHLIFKTKRTLSFGTMTQFASKKVSSSKCDRPGGTLNSNLRS